MTSPHLLQKFESNIGLLRQWLNEDRITDPRKMVTNEELKSILSLQSYGRALLEEVKRKLEGTKVHCNVTHHTYSGEMLCVSCRHNQALSSAIKELEGIKENI